MSHSVRSFDFADDGWGDAGVGFELELSPSRSEEGSFSMEVAATVNPESLSAFHNSFTLARDFQTLNLEDANTCLAGLSNRNEKPTTTRKSSKLDSNRAPERTKKPSTQRSRSTSDAAGLRRNTIDRAESSRSVRRCISDCARQDSIRSMQQPSSARRPAKDASQRKPGSSTRRNDDQGVLHRDVSHSATIRNESEHSRSLRREVRRSTSESQRGLQSSRNSSNKSRSTEKTRSRSKPPQKKSRKSKSMLGPDEFDTNSENEDVDIAEEDNAPQPRTRKLVRRNSFAKLRRTPSSRSIVRTNDDIQAKTKVNALTALVIAKTEKAKTLQQDAATKESTAETGKSSKASEGEKEGVIPLKIPVVKANTQPILNILSGDLWSDEEAVVVNALKILLNLCSEDGENSLVFWMAGYSPICGVMRKWYHIEAIQTLCCQLIHASNSESFAVGVFGCGALEAITCAMENFQSSGIFLSAACSALATLVATTKSEPSTRFAVDLNGADVLMKAMHLFPDSIGIQKYASQAFCSMVRFPQLRENLAEGVAMARKSIFFDEAVLTVTKLSNAENVRANAVACSSA